LKVSFSSTALPEIASMNANASPTKDIAKKFIKWLARLGKTSEKLEGYAYDTYCAYSNIICQFHR
jgi:hypothetical protein